MVSAPTIFAKDPQMRPKKKLGLTMDLKEGRRERALVWAKEVGG